MNWSFDLGVGVRQNWASNKLLLVNEMSGVKPVGRPANQNISYSDDETFSSLSSRKHKRYRSMVGFYCIGPERSRDSSLSADMLASRVKDPTELHMSVAKCGLQYLKGRANRVMMMHLGKEYQFKAVVNFIWG